MIENLSSYYTFYMVAKTKNISNASKELYISQPAVSKTISKLEASLHTKLFIRNTKGVTLTHEGEILYQKLAEAFHAIELGEEQLLFESKLGVGHLNIGVSATLCKHILLPYLQKYIIENPHIKISILCQSTIKTQKDLENGTLDIGLIARSNSDQLAFLKVTDVEDIFVTTESYLKNLKIRSSTSTLNAFSDTSAINHSTYDQVFGEATLMLLDKDNLSRQYIDKYLSANDIYPQNLLEVGTMDLLIEFAKINLGIACVIKNFVEKDLESKKLITYPLPFSIPHREVGFAWQNKPYKNPAIDSFLKFILQ